MAPRVDPYRSFNFLVEIDGITQAGFQECSGLDSQTASIDFRLGDDAPRAGHRLSRPEGPRCAFEETLGTPKIAQAGHDDTAQRQRRGVLAQGNPLQGTQRVAGLEGACRSCDQ